jgi:hypothetical protein
MPTTTKNNNAPARSNPPAAAQSGKIVDCNHHKLTAITHTAKALCNSNLGSIRDYWGGSLDAWHQAVYQAVSEAWAGIESGYSSSHHYLVSERKATAKSIAKWTWKNITQSSFQAYVEMTHLPHQQKARQAKSVESRLIKTQDKRDQAIELRNGGLPDSLYFASQFCCFCLLAVFYSNMSEFYAK